MTGRHFSLTGNVIRISVRFPCIDEEHKTRNAYTANADIVRLLSDAILCTMTYSAPRVKTPPTANFCRVGICSLHIIGHGNAIIMKSMIILETAVP